MSLFKIKICGITRPEDAALVAEAGGDAIGLNFFAESPRFVSDEVAHDIVAATPPSIAKVGVFVNATTEEMRRKQWMFKLDYIQLHGDEPPKTTSELPGVAVIRVLRLHDSAAKHLIALTPPEDRYVRLPRALLVDAYSSDAYGGTGKTVDWSRLPELRKHMFGLPMILAGGLTAENVAEAIRLSQPDAVDTASGVETSPGVKDEAKVRAFVAAAKEAFSALEPSNE